MVKCNLKAMRRIVIKIGKVQKETANDKKLPPEIESDRVITLTLKKKKVREFHKVNAKIKKLLIN